MILDCVPMVILYPHQVNGGQHVRETRMMTDKK